MQDMIRRSPLLESKQYNNIIKRYSCSVMGIFTLLFVEKTKEKPAHERISGP
jgi:hypothetical protein